MAAVLDPAAAVTLAELADGWLSERVRRKTLDAMTARNYRSSLAGFTAHYGLGPPEHLTAGDIEAWLESRGHLSAATRRGDLTAVRGFTDALVRAGWLQRNPAADVAAVKQPESVPRALDPDQVAALLAVCPDRRGRAICWLQVGEGLRCMEVAGLRVEDWSRSTGKLLVHGKNSRQRELPVIDNVTAALDDYLDEHPAADGPLIRSYRRPWLPLTADTISGLVSEWMRAAGIKRSARDGISAHALRHTCASDVLEASHDLPLVQEMLGHRQLQTTSIYLRRANLGRMRDGMTGRSYGADDTRQSHLHRVKPLTALLALSRRADERSTFTSTGKGSG